MNVEVINIKPEHERVLLFLFPTYAYTDKINAVSEFICKHDVRTKAEREQLNYRYENAVIISTKIFDKVWDEEVLIEKALEFSRKSMKTRRRSLKIEKDDMFIDNLIRFMFFPEASEEDASILNMFNTFGSKSFIKEFLLLSQHIPIQVLIASMNTFIAKIIQGDSTSIFYKKKSMLFRDKIRRNFIKSYDNYEQRFKDPTGLSYVKFCNDLIQV